jgi:hypothetical protein
MTLRVIGSSVCVMALATAIAVSSTSAAPAASPKCPTASLVIWLNTQGGGAAAGSSYYKLEFTNQSGHACTLTGFPGVSAVDLHGHQLGSPARKNPSSTRAVRLANGATAAAVLQIVVAGNFPQSACHRAPAAALRVYPPNQTASKLVPFPFDACSRPGPVFLSVKTVA